MIQTQLFPKPIGKTLFLWTAAIACPVLCFTIYMWLSDHYQTSGELASLMFVISIMIGMIPVWRASRTSRYFSIYAILYMILMSLFLFIYGLGFAFVVLGQYF